MKKLLLIPFLFLSLVSYSQVNLFGGIGSRVLDSATYRASAAVTAAHSNGYKDIYYNAQATTPHWDIWNGSSYDHVFSFGSGGGASAWGAITGTLSDQTDLQSALDAKEDLLETVSSSTAGATITLDFDNDTQKIFVGSASFATGKALAFSNDTNAEVFDFHFEVTNVAATLNFGANVQMFDANWDVGTTTWTPPATGEYEIAGSFDGTNWRIKAVGPYDTTPTSGGGTPGGSDTYVQYNDASAFGGEADFTYDETTNTLTVDVVAVDTEAYDATGWNGDLSVPTKDATRDKIETLESILTSNSASTASGTITLDMNSERQRMFVGSATFATSKTISITNATNALVFNFQFEVTSVAGELVFPSAAIMSDVNWDSGTDTWTPPSTGKYECGGIYDGTNWRIKIIGPFN